MIGGVTVNFIMALFIYAMILFKWGQEYIPVQNAVYGYEFCETALKNGFRNGDRIIAVDGVEYEMMFDMIHHIVLDNAKHVTVERDGQQMDVTIPADFTAQYLASKEKVFAQMCYPWVVERTISDSPAEKAGLTTGDTMVAVNETPVTTISMFIAEIKGNAGKEINLTFRRNGIEEVIKMRVSDEGTIGVYAQRPETILQSKKIEYGFFASFPAGIKYGVDRLTKYGKDMRIVFTKDGWKQTGGFISIASIFPAMWDWSAFWSMTAFLSIMLAFMNILPIPALDGGHVLFLLFEIITGRKPSDKFLERAQIVGMILLLGLLVLANGNDIVRLFQIK